MYKVVIINLLSNEPGTCYLGFEDEKEVKDWLKHNNLDAWPWRFVIFKQEIDIRTSNTNGRD